MHESSFFSVVCHSGIYLGPLRHTQPGHSLWVGSVSTGGGFGHRWGRNGEFCVAVCPITRTGGILTFLYASL